MNTIAKCYILWYDDPVQLEVRFLCVLRKGARSSEMKQNKRIVSYIITTILIITLFSFLPPVRGFAAVTGEISAGCTYVYFRESPGGNIIQDGDGNVIYLHEGHKLTILDQSNSSWYKVRLKYNGVKYTGYVYAEFITVAGETKTETTEENGSPVALSDDEFENAMAAQGFPESYKSMLRDIHANYPYWEFQAVQTGIDWNTLVDNEINKRGQIKNLVYCGGYEPHYNWRATAVGYDYQYDKWSPYDGSTWFAASDELVEYYLDPRTYLYENYIFVFESLSYQKGVHNKKGVEAVLKGSFMAGTKPTGSSKTYAQIIMEAAEASGVSPYHIASRIRQEVGGGSSAVTGNHSVYPGIYNFYNIGAFDSGDGTAVTKGLQWAASSGSYGRPWTTPAKSIIGGAQYLGASYISVGQDTLYTQKFNVTNTGNLFSHQYMTNVQAPASECLSAYNAYASNNLLGSSMVFKIPVYKNMPDSPVEKPTDQGSPNNWLKSLSVSGYTLTPSFSISMTTDYSLIVSANVKTVTVSAKTVNSKAKVKGTGTLTLKKGTNIARIVVTAEGGAKRTYQLTVVRGDATQSVNDATIGGGGGGGTTTVTTGGKGDLNGDGKISALDIVRVQRLIVGIDAQTNAMLAAGDINGDGKISALDIVKIQRHIVGLESIQ